MFQAFSKDELKLRVEGLRLWGKEQGHQAVKQIELCAVVDTHIQVTRQSDLGCRHQRIHAMGDNTRMACRMLDYKHFEDRMRRGLPLNKFA